MRRGTAAKGRSKSCGKRRCCSGCCLGGRHHRASVRAGLAQAGRRAAEARGARSWSTRPPRSQQLAVLIPGSGLRQAVPMSTTALALCLGLPRSEGRGEREGSREPRECGANPALRNFGPGHLLGEIPAPLCKKVYAFRATADISRLWGGEELPVAWQGPGACVCVCVCASQECARWAMGQDVCGVGVSRRG